MNEHNARLDQLERALWQAPPSPSVNLPPIEVWQANVMRSVRLAQPQIVSLLDLPWLIMQRAAVAAVVVAALGWLAAQVWMPIHDSDLAQAAWTQSVAETWNME